MTIGTIVSIITSLFTALFLFYWQRGQTKRDKATDSRAEARRCESLLVLESIQAIGALSDITAKKVLNQKTNGDVVAAQANYTIVRDKLDGYLRRNSVEANH